MSNPTDTGHRIIATHNNQGAQGDVYTSEYQDAFRSRPWQAPREALKPTVIRGVSTLSYPVDMVSCTKRTFVPHKPKGPPRSYKPKENEWVKIPDAKMEADTTYTVEFKDKTGSPRRPPYKPNEKSADSKPFDAKSVYQAHFKKFDQEELSACKVEKKPHPDNLGKEEKPIFNAQSTAQDSFRNLGKVIPPTPLKPEENTHIDRTKPLETETTHRAEFKPKTLPQNYPTASGAASSSRPHPPSGPKPNPPSKNVVKYDVAANPQQIKKKLSNQGREAFDDLTVFRRDFVDHRVTTPQKSYKPKYTYRKNPSKFDGRTTHRQSYQPLKITTGNPRPPWADRDNTVVVSKAQRARLDLTTCYQEAFRDPSRLIPMEKCRGVTYKLENNLSGSGAGGDKHAPMEGKTSYKTSYVPYEIRKKTESFKVKRFYEIPKAPFFGVSTSNAHYRGVPSPPAKSCKPLVRPRSSPGKMSNLTTYRSQFGRRAASCPPPIQGKQSPNGQANRKTRTSQTQTVPPNTAATSNNAK